MLYIQIISYAALKNLTFTMESGVAGEHSWICSFFISFKIGRFSGGPCIRVNSVRSTMCSKQPKMNLPGP